MDNETKAMLCGILVVGFGCLALLSVIAWVGAEMNARDKAERGPTYSHVQEIGDKKFVWDTDLSMEDCLFYSRELGGRCELEV